MNQPGMERGRWMSALLVGTAFCLAGSVARGQDAVTGSRSPSGASPSAIQWLRAVGTAAQRANYTGTIVYMRGDEVRSSRIVHFFDGTAPRERVLTLDGRPREFIRQGEEVQCLYPKLRRIVIEHGGPHATFPALGQIDPNRVLEHYALTEGDMERVAGLECRMLQLGPLDSKRYGYRLCVEPRSGLLMKIKVMGDDDEVIEQVAFSDVRIGDSISASELKPSWSTAGWEVVRHPSHQIVLSRQGWSITAPDGFQILTEVERRLGDSAQEALQAVYSDGLATVSVFIEPGAAVADQESPPQHHGPSSAFMRRVGDARVTVVGEVPPMTARSIADSVHFIAGH
ncbi:MAG TPA: MucB/RseB C-terminal domain-containing protein [Burkholderiaceae bacterium]|nr:MucB/RseB C-terminal domain-containing protein [Burkholderiaceae bacterium]